MFFVVLLSVLAQGTTIPATARRLGLAEPLPPVDRYSFGAVIAGDEGHSLRELRVTEGAPAVGRSVLNLGLPARVLFVLVYRGGQVVVPQGGTTLEAADRVLLVAGGQLYETARLMLQGSGEGVRVL